MTTIANEKSHRHSKHYTSRTNSNRSLTSRRRKMDFVFSSFKYIETRSTTTATSVYIQRDIHISSSSYRLWTSNLLKYLLLFYQFRIIYR
jgi:hypothetical protein